jgi:Arc/MetJ family transcription regulator
MKTTIAIDDDLFAKAQEFASVTEQSAVIREALKAFVERGRMQAGSHGGELPSAVAPQRRRQRRNPG